MSTTVYEEFFTDIIANIKSINELMPPDDMCYSDFLVECFKKLTFLHVNRSKEVEMKVNLCSHVTGRRISIQKVILKDIIQNLENKKGMGGLLLEGKEITEDFRKKEIDTLNSLDYHSFFTTDRIIDVYFELVGKIAWDLMNGVDVDELKIPLVNRELGVAIREQLKNYMKDHNIEETIDSMFKLREDREDQTTKKLAKLKKNRRRWNENDYQGLIIEKYVKLGIV